MTHPQRLRGDRAFLCRGLVPAGDLSPIALTPWPTGAPSWLGPSPQLSFAEAGVATDACEARPAVLRLALTVSGGGHIVRAHVDYDLRRVFVAGHVVWLGVDRRGGVGLSVVRGERLVCAVGAIMAVPLADVAARYAPELWEPPVIWLNTPEREADRICAEAAVCVPLEVTAPGGLRPPLPSRRLDEGALTLFHHASFRVTQPVMSLPVAHADWVDACGAHSECAAIARVGACPLVAAGTSAMLLAADGFTPVA